MKKYLAPVLLALCIASPALADDTVLKIGDVELANQNIVSWSVATEGRDAVPYLDVKFDETHAGQMERSTAAKIGQQLPIMLCGQQIADPVIKEAIRGNTAFLPLPVPYDDHVACLDQSKKVP